LTKRNFYLSLFRIYSSLPFEDCLVSFAKIFNDVFVYEKPLSILKYYLTECMIVEMNQPFDEPAGDFGESHTVPFSYNFARGTSKQVRY